MRLILAVALAASLCGRAAADHNDPTLQRITGRPSTSGGLNDPTDLTRQSMYKSLMSELGVVMAPRLLSPADTLGWSGFQLSFDSSFTQISRTADFWQQGVESVHDSFLPTLTLLARKGLPLGFEIGAGGAKLMDSELYSLQAYVKVGLHEGYHRLPIPSLALRAAVSHLLGSSQVDLTVISIDATVSKSFGLRGLVKLDPYLGANALLSIARGQVIDTTPGIDAYKQGPTSLDLNANTTFPDPDPILRWRLFTGFRLVYSVAALAAELAYVLCNDSGERCGESAVGGARDRSGGQLQLSLSGGVVF